MSDDPRLTRRSFLKYAGFGSATLITEDAVRKAGRLVPYVIPPERLEPGIWHTLATTCRECPAGCGMHVWHRDGRITKAEGNPDHPVNRGGLCARGQSALQGIYDPDRLKSVFYRNKGSTLETATWERAFTEIGRRLMAGRTGQPPGRLLVVSRLERGALAEILTRFTEPFGADRPIYFEPFNYTPLRKAHQSLFGTAVIPRYHLDRCDYILSFGADFLETWISNVEFSDRFSMMHSLRDGRIGYFTYIGPRRSMTACNADCYLQVSPDDQRLVGLGILKILHDENLLKQDRDRVKAFIHQTDMKTPPVAADRLRSIAHAFARADGKVALPGPVGAAGRDADELALIVGLLNAATGCYGTTIDLTQPHALTAAADEDDFNRFLNSLTGRDAVLILRADPVYARPGSEMALRRAGLIVYCGTMLNETAALSDWILPINDDLESWGDYEPYAGIHGLMQPTMRPLANTKEAGDIFLTLAGFAGQALQRTPGGAELRTIGDWVRARWNELHASSSWEEDQRQGGFWLGKKEMAGRRPGIRRGPLEIPNIFEQRITADLKQNEAALWLWSSVLLFDGRVSNRGWLQENPEPVSTVVWGSRIDIHPDKARPLGIAHGDVIELASGNRRVQAPARLTDEVAPETVALCLGQGHNFLGKIAAGLGANGFLLMPDVSGQRNGKHGFFGIVTIRKTGDHEDIITATATKEQHNRDLLQWKKVSDVKRMKPGPLRFPHKEGYALEKDLYAPHRHAGHRWAMAVDIQRCIGCQACAVACYAENNLFVVGRHQTKWSRNMPWLRIVPYRHPEKPDRIAWLPMLCQHCDDAPCEPVCPVFASVNNEEGLNAQIYNRCIGTRYCSNNCPYKVRRFNFLNTQWREPLNFQLNPEVTVRCRGVMEKCTFCVQRIRNAEYRAVRENRAIRDGEIQPACGQSCPAKVYTFGDLLDPDSLVSKIIRNDPRRYQVLQDLNTKPAVIYLYKIEQE